MTEVRKIMTRNTAKRHRSKERNNARDKIGLTGTTRERRTDSDEKVITEIRMTK